MYGLWNSLPFSVITAPAFKNRLDNHWASQELTYDWELEAELNFELFEFCHYIF